MLSLQMWQSEFPYLGLILVEKEETLAASGRSNSFESAFVSTFIKTQIDREGGWQSQGKRGVWSHTNRETERERDSKAHVKKTPFCLWRE